MRKPLVAKACDYTLYVRCNTYNQKDFIVDSLNGFAIQKTSFLFACIIVDDNSQDGEPDIIMDYLKENCDPDTFLQEENELYLLIYAKHNVNRNCDYFAYLLKKNLYKDPELRYTIVKPWVESCKYEAWCEGDDYWIDENKLQSEYDVLDNISDVSFVYTGFESVDESGKKKERPFLEVYKKHSHSGNVFFDLLVNLNFIMTLTVVFRTSCRKDVPYYYYDYGYFLNWARQGKAVFLPQITSCYRYNRNSITNTVKDSLLPRFYKIVLNEVGKAYQKKDTADFIYNNKYFKTILGYIIARNIRKSTEKKRFFIFLMQHPGLYYYALKGLLIKLFAENSIRKYVNTL